MLAVISSAAQPSKALSSSCSHVDFFIADQLACYSACNTSVSAPSQAAQGLLHLSCWPILQALGAF